MKTRESNPVFIVTEGLIISTVGVEMDSKVGFKAIDRVVEDNSLNGNCFSSLGPRDGK